MRNPIFVHRRGCHILSVHWSREGSLERTSKVSMKPVKRAIYAGSLTAVAPRKLIAEKSAAAHFSWRTLAVFYSHTALDVRGFNSRVFMSFGLPYLRPECDCGLVGAYTQGMHGSPHLHAPFFSQRRIGSLTPKGTKHRISTA